ncbi:hypothetical protein HPB50_021928 [Hyalomma asiaticum]|uniref:Uncharacterized protein n=1 Tax=Hyalomma asiaticum TaxID=266040 RepID=A0ACB7SYY1_HYAAI|nr:hypothetical protein HPB50_021928 [Hyalomma asiaticum]
MSRYGVPSFIQVTELNISDNAKPDLKGVRSFFASITIAVRLPPSLKEQMKSSTEASGDSQEKGDGAAVLAASIKAPDAREEDATRENIVQATTEACAGGPAKEGLDMECEESATPVVGKRQLEVSEENGKPEASAGEPLPKAQFTRRPTLKIQPKASQGATSDTTGLTGDAPSPEVHPPASSGHDTGNGVVPVRERQDSVLAGSSETTGERGGVHTPANAGAAASKRPHHKASSDGTQETAPAAEEPPAKTVQVRRSSLRPRPNVTSDRRGGAADPVGQLPAGLPDGTAGDGTT